MIEKWKNLSIESKKRIVWNLLLFIQFILIQITSVYELTPDTIKHISFILLLIGYWIDKYKTD